MLLVHGTADRVVSVKPARRYAKRAQDAGRTVALIEIDGPAGRTARTSTRGQAWTAVTRWLGQPADA